MSTGSEEDLDEEGLGRRAVTAQVAASVTCICMINSASCFSDSDFLFLFCPPLTSLSLLPGEGVCQTGPWGNVCGGADPIPGGELEIWKKQCEYIIVIHLMCPGLLSVCGCVSGVHAFHLGMSTSVFNICRSPEGQHRHLGGSHMLSKTCLCQLATAYSHFCQITGNEMKQNLWICLCPVWLEEHRLVKQYSIYSAL